MSTRIASLADSLGLSRSAMAERLGISPSHCSRLMNGVQQETATLEILLDLIARQHGLLHLVVNSKGSLVVVADQEESTDETPDVAGMPPEAACSAPGGL